MILNQRNVPSPIELCHDNLAETGAMTECITVLIATNQNRLFGVHCGGGLDDEWVEKIVKSFEDQKHSEEKAQSVVAIFGATYQNESELDFIDYKMEYARRITHALDAVGLNISSANAQISLDNGMLYPLLPIKIWSERNHQWI